MINYTNFEEFKNCFKFDTNKVLDITQHSNPNVLGFSAYILPSEKMRKNLEIEDGFEYRTLLAVYFNKYKSDKNGVQPLVVHILFALYDKKNKLGDYVLDYSHIKNKNKLPIEIYDCDTYYFDSNKKTICKNDSVSIDTYEEFKKLYDYHIKLTKGLHIWIYNFKKFFLQLLPTKIVSFFITIFNTILFFFTGKKIQNTFLKKFNYQSAESETESKSNEINAEKIDFFGLEVKPVPLFTYSLLHLIGYGIMYYMKIFPNWIKQLLNYNMLTVIYVIVSYMIYTKFSELILSSIIRVLFKMRNLLLRIKIKP